jgi:hypothetical protein
MPRRLFLLVMADRSLIVMRALCERNAVAIAEAATKLRVVRIESKPVGTKVEPSSY